MKKIIVIHPADERRFLAGGLFRAPRFFKDGDGGDDWRAALPEDVRSDPTLKDYKDVSSVAKALIETKKFVGTSIRVPGPEASADDRQKFRERLRQADPDLVEIPKDPAKRKEVESSIWETLGRPKDEKGYSLEGVELNGVQFSDEELAAARKQAQEDGLTIDQFRKNVTRAAAARTAASRGAKEMQDALRTEFGAAFDEKMKELELVAEKTGAPQALKDAIGKKAIDKATALYLLNVGKSLGTDTREISTQRNPGAGVVTPREAEARISEILANPEFYKNGPQAEVLKDRLAYYERFASPDLAGAGA